MSMLLDPSVGVDSPAVISGATRRVTVSTVMVGALVTWRFKNSLAAFASAKIEVLRVSSMAADADDVGETMVISTRVDAA
jgi:hypothetical protein